MARTFYIDNSANVDGPLGILFADRDVHVIYTGLEVQTENGGSLLDEISRLCGLDFFSKEQPIPLYGVPCLWVFASDAQGGWFAGTKDEQNGPVYHIDRDLTPHLIAEHFGALLELAASDPDWRKKRLGGTWRPLPDDPDGRKKLSETLRLPFPTPKQISSPGSLPKVFVSREEAEREFPILDIWTVLREKKSPRFQIHPMMSPQDWEGRAFVHYQAWRETYPGMMPEEVLAKHTLERCRESANDRRFSNSGNTLVALDREDGDRVVGFATLSHRARNFVSVEDAGEIVALYVLQDFQGLGLGKELLESCLARLTQARTALFVLRENEKAIGFYQHMGFRFTGHEVTQDGMTELEMVLEKSSGR